ncbi:hypothetical protein D878_gp11 [Sulfolobales Mexican rudivirus 1]|uniref:Uncharacterized protein n=1 Tax=Sulfolobales Mexican rod-shaped virus 1 TaxID=2848122 RepID=K4NZA3_9VIRU|nr:hypothetical protein D878_gp11 [Sulfolobales Mexican rudivirus 1]AFV51238.1 hypothetical protein [Sulfolobales Mexican rod-shaped virus 1]
MSVTYASIDQLIAKPFQRLTSAMWNTATLLLVQLYETGGNAVSSVLQNGNLYLPGTLTARSGNFLYQVYVQGEPVLTEEDPIYISGFIDLASRQIEQILYAQQQLYTEIGYLPQNIYVALAQNLIPPIYETVVRAVGASSLYQEIQQLPGQIYNAIVDTKILNLPREIYNALSAFPITYVPGLIYEVLSSFLAYFYSQTVALTNAINKLALYLAPSTIEGLQLNVSTTPAPLYSGPSIETVKIILQNLSNYVVYLGNSLYNNFPLLPNSSIEFHIKNPANIYAWATGTTTVYALFEVVQSSS